MCYITRSLSDDRTNQAINVWCISFKSFHAFCCCCWWWYFFPWFCTRSSFPVWRITIRNNLLSFFARSYTAGLNYGHWYCNMAEYSYFMTAFSFHCQDIDWLSSLVPGLFPVVCLSSDVTSPGDKAAQEHAKFSFPGFPHLIMAFWLFYFILFFFYGEGVAWSRPFRSSHGGGGGEEPWSWPVEMFSVETRFEGLPELGALNVCKNCPNCQKKWYYNGMPNSLSKHFLQLRDFYFQTVKLGSVNQQAWIRGKASILSAAKNNSKRS